MKNNIIATVSVIALMATATSPALADTKSPAPGSKAAAEQSTGDFSKDVDNAWKDMKHDASEAYEDIKATIVGKKDKDGTYSTFTINSRMTADGMIGNPVRNGKGESIGTVKDIILDSNGKAIMVVVADGEFVGLGKKVAFDYNAITRVNADGDVIMPLTEEMIDTAATFSYDQKDSDKDVRVIPSNGYSVSKLLDGQLVNPKKETVAQIDNIVFRNGRADQLIVGFDKILGMGGEKAALAYRDAQLIPDGDGYDFQLTANQAAEFDAYKQTVTN
jgi:sporulation protein YlmC with PRC-barrel domain